MSSKILTALFLVGGASALYAGPVYSCGGGSACNGNLYAVWVVSQTATSYILVVGIKATTGYTGSAVDSIDDLAIIPDNQHSFTAASLVSNPLGTWTVKSGGLGASGCDGSRGGYICATGMGHGSHLFSFSNGIPSPNLLIWQFQLTGKPPSLGDTVNIKFHYDHLGGVGITDSGLVNVAIQCTGGRGCLSTSLTSADIQAAPEPVTFALVGSGLIAFYFLRRRLPGPR
jgi:hypothetical protein